MSFSIDQRIARFLPPEAELSEQFIRSSGPGGQHVNRTESGVQLRFDAAHSSFLNEPVRERLIELAGHRADSNGVILIEATSHRSQHRNREAARERLADLIERAHRRPRKRIATRPTRSAKKKRLEAKRHRGRIKNKRGKPALDD